MPEPQTQVAPDAPNFQKDFSIIYECRIPQVDCICVTPEPPQQKKPDDEDAPKPPKKNCACSVFGLEKQNIISVENRAGYNPEIKPVVKKSEISLEIRQSPGSKDMTILQVFKSLGKSRKIIVPEARILQIIKSSTRKCSEIRNEIYLSPQKTINFFVKQKVKKGSGERLFVFRLIMTKAKKFKVIILSINDPEIIKGEEGHLWAIDCCLKH